jgi:CYTH domain-containing protein
MTNPNTKNQEIERKFLVDLEKWCPLDKGTHILQFYLSDNPTVRIRIADIKGYITIKGPTINITRPEFEYNIPVDDALDMIKMAIYLPIEKTRYDIEHNGLNWTIDVFEG